VGHENIVTSVCLSPNNKFILSTGLVDNSIKLWDANTGLCLKTFSEHTSAVNSAHFSPNGCFVVSGSNDNTVKLWDVNTGECLGTFLEHSNPVQSVCFSSDGNYVLSGDNHGRIIPIRLNWNKKSNVPENRETLSDKQRKSKVSGAITPEHPELLLLFLDREPLTGRKAYVQLVLSELLSPEETSDKVHILITDSSNLKDTSFLTVATFQEAAKEGIVLDDDKLTFRPYTSADGVNGVVGFIYAQKATLSNSSSVHRNSTPLLLNKTITLTFFWSLVCLLIILKSVLSLSWLFTLGISLTIAVIFSLLIYRLTSRSR
jgi:hypothetical protein